MFNEDDETPVIDDPIVDEDERVEAEEEADDVSDSDGDDSSEEDEQDEETPEPFVATTQSTEGRVYDLYDSDGILKAEGLVPPFGVETAPGDELVLRD